MYPFVVATFFGAFLLFQVQPLIGKYILPWFGGGPGVWTACLMFFQVALLAGYAYAHLLSRWLKPKAQAVVHVALIAAAIVSLPITPDAHWKPATPDAPVLRILALLVSSLGLPYLAVSATGPLMQAWFRLLQPGVSPYRLYALSNAGSLLALLSYPVVFERWLTRNQQASLWGWALGLFAVAAALCAWRVFRSEHSADSPKIDPTEGSEAPPTSGARALWFALPACASILLLAVTNTMCQDVAVVPFLWVLPLSLYLLSFILCFDAPRWYSRKWYGGALLAALGAICFSLHSGHGLPLTLQIVIYSASLFIFCMLAHGELYRLKPAPRHLTSFYLLISAGGAVGGTLVAVVAPNIFQTYAELHWGLWGLSALLVVILYRQKAVLTLAGSRWSGWMAGAAGLCVLAAALLMESRKSAADAISRARNFYGVLTVRERFFPELSLTARALMHGTTMHGVQVLPPGDSLRPIGYYSKGSGAELVFSNFPRRDRRRIGVVGLGIGTLSVYADPTDTIRFYEINPEIERYARSNFTYLARARARVEVVLGDARIMLENESPQEFDLLVLDAFSSDAIPVHLLTREAFALYRRHLKPDGVVLANITNRHLDLEPVLHDVSDEFGWQSLTIPGKRAAGRNESADLTWMVITRNFPLLDNPSLRGAARPRPLTVRRVRWTDERTSLMDVLIRR